MVVNGAQGDGGSHNAKIVKHWLRKKDLRSLLMILKNYIYSEHCSFSECSNLILAGIIQFIHAVNADCEDFQVEGICLIPSSAGLPVTTSRIH